MTNWQKIFTDTANEQIWRDDANLKDSVVESWKQMKEKYYREGWHPIEVSASMKTNKKVIAWIEENCTGGQEWFDFTSFDSKMNSNSTVYFEKEDEAMAFKLAWT